MSAERVAELESTLRRIAEFQPRRIKWFRDKGIMFIHAPRCNPASWEGVAFWTYTDLCEIDAIVKAALSDVASERDDEGYELGEAPD